MSSSEDESDVSLDQSSDDEEFFEDAQDALQAIFDAEDEGNEGVFKGFPIQLPENMNWSHTPFQADIEEHSLQCGPTENTPCEQSALEYFQLFLDNRLIEEITEFTHEKAIANRAVGWKQTNNTSRDQGIFCNDHHLK